MSETGSISPEERRRRAEAKLARSRPSREAAAAAHLVSFHRDEIRQIKIAITGGAPYAERISFGFAIRLFLLEQSLHEAGNVLREIDVLEGLAHVSFTQAASQFEHPPLAPLWHKHFYSSRHFIRNVGNRWDVHPDKPAKRHKDLNAMLSDIAREFGQDPDVWPEALAYSFVTGAIRERLAEKRMTGDWIVYAQHEGKNYYLDLAEHEEGKLHPQRLADKIRDGSRADFPFLFPR